MSTLPTSAICAYSLGELGPLAAAELVCLRPFAGPGERRSACTRTSPTFALSGELDKSCTDLFATTVERVPPVMEPADEMVIDETGLTFVEHRAMLTLDHHLGRLGVQGLLRTPCSTATRLAELLGLSCLRVEQVPVQSASRRS